MKRHRLTAAVLLASTLAGGSQVLAFGIAPEENNLGSEHQKITRSALKELEPLTLSALAGAGSNTGAIGFPDTTQGGLTGRAEAHCLGGDHAEGISGAVPTREAAQAALDACRTFIRANLEKAVELAGKLATPAAEDTGLDCRFGSQEQSAKCRIIEHLGLALHATQDFYANSNWVDRPSEAPASVDNPPGLGQAGPAPWLDLRRNEPLPDGLISACPPNRLLLGLSLGCEDDVLAGVADTGRISTGRLSKATGPIGRGTGGTGTTTRGAINGNFTRAVTAAIADTADKWAYFAERVDAVHGTAAGARILCALRRDAPDPQSCEAEMQSAQVCEARAAAPRPLTSVEPAFEPRLHPSSREIERAGASLPRLASYCQIEEADVTRFFANGGGTTEEGKAQAERAARESLGFWGECRRQLKQYLPKLQAELRAQPDTREKFLGTYAACVLDAHMSQGKR